MRHVPRDATADRSRRRDARRDVGRGTDDRARGRAHVVRRSGDDEVVERDLAQRGVRHLHGAPGHRRVQTRMEDVGRFRARTRGRPRRRRAREHPHRRIRGGHPVGRRRHVRHPHLPKGWFGVAHARTLARRRRVPGRRAALPVALSAREHRDDRPVGRARGSHRTAGEADHGHLDLPTRVPDRARRRGTTRTTALFVLGYRTRRAMGAPGPRPRPHRRASGDAFLALRRENHAPRSTGRLPGGTQRRGPRVLPRRLPHRVAGPPARRRRAGTARTVRAGRRSVGMRARRPRPRDRIPRLRAAVRGRDRPRRVAHDHRAPPRRDPTRRRRRARSHARRDRRDRSADDATIGLGRPFRRRAHASIARPARQRARVDGARPRDDRAGA